MTKDVWTGPALAGRLIAACALAAVMPAAHADKPLWEFGLGAAALHVEHYRGSDQYHDWLLPVPYFVYRGKIFKSDRDGTRAVLVDTDRFDVDLSLGASPPASSSGNRARAGMPDLSPTFEIGPKVQWRLGGGPGWKLDLRLPVRAAFKVGSHARGVGATFSPVLNLDVDWAGWQFGAQGGPLAASRAYNAYFYDVDPAYATATRPAYRSRSGAAGWALTGSASRRIGDWWLAAFVRADSLSGAVFADSPLVRQRQNVTYGLAASWVFKTSDARVPDTP